MTGATSKTEAMTPISRRLFLVGSVAVVIASCNDDPASGPATDPAIESTAATSALPASTTTEQAPPSSPADETTTTTLAETTTTTQPVDLQSDPFTLGVASGDPDPRSVILWTRLAPDPLNGGGMPDVDVDVRWELSADDAFEELIATGTERALAEHAHTVHVTATPPAATTGAFFYRFLIGEFVSPIGRTMLAPTGAVQTATFVSASCQNYQSGFYAAHRDIAEHRPDFLVWLGDYIYEGTAATVGEGSAVRTHGTAEPTDLAAYRDRYALYKSDRNLQSAHQACPWFVIWDDHEVENNYAGETPQDIDEAAGFTDRRHAAYIAWWEHQPVRLDPPTADGDYRIYRDARWGDLLGMSLLDTRQYRTDQACGDISLSLDPTCPETFDDDRTLTGDEQEQWLYDTVGSHGTVWNVIAQQLVMSNLTLNGAVLNYDQWDGYPKSRERVLQHLADAAIPNAVVLSGDIHLAGVGVLRVGEPGVGQPVAIEFVDTSISSTGNVPPEASDLVKSFPDIVDAELFYRGYTLHSVTPDTWTAEYRIVDSIIDEGSPVSVYKTFAVDSGTVAVRVVE